MHRPHFRSGSLEVGPTSQNCLKWPSWFRCAVKIHYPRVFLNIAGDIFLKVLILISFNIPLQVNKRKVVQVVLVCINMHGYFFISFFKFKHPSTWIHRYINPVYLPRQRETSLLWTFVISPFPVASGVLGPSPTADGVGGEEKEAGLWIPLSSKRRKRENCSVV